MRNTNYLFASQVGKDLENKLVKLFLESKTVDCKPATTYEDECLGTDLFVEGIPVDFTCGMAKKDHIVKTARYGEDWTLAIRTGNSYRGGTLFDTPVVVVALNTDDMAFVREWVIPHTSRFVGSIRKMADSISDLFCQYDDEVNGD